MSVLVQRAVQNLDECINVESNQIKSEHVRQSNVELLTLKMYV